MQTSESASSKVAIAVEHIQRLVFQFLCSYYCCCSVKNIILFICGLNDDAF